MMEINPADRLLFMRFAVPCAGTLVRRGTITQQHWDDLIAAVARGGPIPAGSERIFKVAYSACSIIAIDAHKPEIDRDVIYEYYLFRHDAMIDERYAEMRDFDPQACRIRAGVVQSVGPGVARVETMAGSRDYRTDFTPQVRSGDRVITHWDFVVEPTDAAIAEKMARQKISLQIK